jgi:hypothetical protein
MSEDVNYRITPVCWIVSGQADEHAANAAVGYYALVAMEDGSGKSKVCYPLGGALVKL